MPPSDRPWLTDVQKVQKLQEKVYVALQRCLQKDGASEEKLTRVSPPAALLCAFAEKPKALVCNAFWLFLSRWCPNSQS